MRFESSLIQASYRFFFEGADSPRGRSGYLPMPPCFLDLTSPAAGNVGNTGRNAFYGPSYTDFDFSLQKNFAITEGKKFRFQADFFNLFNHPNFDLPVSNLGSLSAGKIIGDTNANPRLMQLGLRFDW